MSRHRLLATVLVLVSCTTPDVSAPTGELTAMVTHVYDGDTIEVETEGRRIDVRLHGLNAPENGECHDTEATEGLTTAVLGAVVRLTTKGEDQFGRLLAVVWRGEVSINLGLVTEGLAIATTPDSGDPTTMIEAEERAYRDGLGLWGACGVGQAPAVIIDQVVNDPPGPDGEDLGGERVVVINSGDTAVDLAGWSLRDESSRHRHRFDDVVLEPGESLVVTSADSGWEPGGGPVWNNDGDMALLLDERGRVVSRYRY
ncbi:MAG: lamin tail domain-containing protein [Actinobacteria bacterium]|nr:lamin tail domain-containing protein [Actinomycetota bacterium]